VNSVQGGDYNMALYDETWFATHWGHSNVGVKVRNFNNVDVYVKEIIF
jgi:hypothetical protein